MVEALPTDPCDGIDITEFATTSIYHGRQLKGFYVVLDTGEFEALDHSLAPLGVFRKAKDARQALVATWECVP
jgi:hypothetical protein